MSDHMTLVAFIAPVDDVEQADGFQARCLTHDYWGEVHGTHANGWSRAMRKAADDARAHQES